MYTNGNESSTKAVMHFMATLFLKKQIFLCMLEWNYSINTVAPKGIWTINTNLQLYESLHQITK